MPADEPIPWEQNRRRDLEAVMTDEVPGLGWHVRELSPPGWNPLASRRSVVSTDLGVYRYVQGLTEESARKLAHELALAVRLRDG